MKGKISGVWKWKSWKRDNEPGEEGPNSDEDEEEEKVNRPGRKHKSEEPSLKKDYKNSWKTFYPPREITQSEFWQKTKQNKTSLLLTEE